MPTAARTTPRRPSLGPEPTVPLETLITGRIATLAGDRGFGWVEAIGIRAGRIAFAGTEVDLETRADPFTVRIRLESHAVAVPGLTDAHLHLVQAAMATRQVDLSASPMLDDGLARIRAAHEALSDADAWIEGHGWDSDRWGGWPTADALETVAPGRRIAIWAHDHHALWASHAALSGADLGTGDPPGGVIRRRADGTPEGVLLEAATRLVTIHVPPMPRPNSSAPSSKSGGNSSRWASSRATIRAEWHPIPISSFRTRCTRPSRIAAGCRSGSTPACATTRSPQPSSRAIAVAPPSARIRPDAPGWAGRSASRTAHSGHARPPSSRTSSLSPTGPWHRASVAESG